MILRDVFSLDEHPFDPARDPATNFDFRAQKVALTRALELFRFDQLQRFYSRVGPLGLAATQATAQLPNFGYPAGGGDSPVVLIASSPGQGFSSLASLVAAWVRAAAPAPAPSFVRVPIVSDHFGKALLLIGKQLLTHLQGASSPVAEQVRDMLADIKPEDPDETYLLPNLEVLSAQAVDIPPFLLVLEKLTYSRFDWLARLHRVLKGYNAMLICLTDDAKVPPLFLRDIGTARFPGFLLTLNGLTRQEALTFLGERLRLFRVAAAPADRTGIYPFLERELDKAYTGQDRLNIRLLIRLLKDLFDAKLDQQQRAEHAGAPSSAGPLVTASVGDVYLSALKAIAMPGVNASGVRPDDSRA